MSQAPMAGYTPRRVFGGAGAQSVTPASLQFYDDALESVVSGSTQYTILAELGRFRGPPDVAELASALVSERSAVATNRGAHRDGYGRA